MSREIIFLLDRSSNMAGKEAEVIAEYNAFLLQNGRGDYNVLFDEQYVPVSYTHLAGGECLGIVCVVDRTKADAPSPIPSLASAAKLDLPNYAPEECPICKEGKLPLVHLGSRKMKEQARQTL